MPAKFQLALLMLCVTNACSSQTSALFSAGGDADTGALGVQLSTPSGFALDRVRWRVTQSAASEPRTGSLSTEGRRSLAFVVESLEAGRYTLVLDAMTADGAQACAVTASLSVAARKTTTVSARLSCHKPDDAQSVAVSSAEPLTAQCAAVTTLIASPAEVFVGETLLLSASGVSAALPGATPHFTWSVVRGPGNALLQPTAANQTTLTCTRPGALSVRATAAVSGETECLNSALTHTVQCDPPIKTTKTVDSPDDVVRDTVARTNAQPASSCATQQSACDGFLADHHSELLNANQRCSGTERLLFGKDVSGQAPGACLGCALKSGCLNDTYAALGAAVAGGTQRECEDLVTGAGASQAAVDTCLAVLGCDLHVGASCPSRSEGAAPVWDCSRAQGIVNSAYCGPHVSVEACLGHGADRGPQGRCAESMTAGFPADATPGFILNHMTDSAQPAGTANKLVACALANCASACFP
jgi:hypothetical protein